MNAMVGHPRARLTLGQFEERVSHINNGWVKWWTNWDHQTPAHEMAVCCINKSARPIEYPALEEQGFEKTVTADGLIVYVCERAD